MGICRNGRKCKSRKSSLQKDLREMKMSQFWKKDFFIYLPIVYYYKWLVIHFQIKQSEKRHIVYNTWYYTNFSHFKSDFGSSYLFLFNFLFSILDCFALSVHFEFKIKWHAKLLEIRLYKKLPTVVRILGV